MSTHKPKLFISCCDTTYFSGSASLILHSTKSGIMWVKNKIATHSEPQFFELAGHILLINRVLIIYFCMYVLIRVLFFFRRGIKKIS